MWRVEIVFIRLYNVAVVNAFTVLTNIVSNVEAIYEFHFERASNFELFAGVIAKWNEAEGARKLERKFLQHGSFS